MAGVVTLVDRVPGIVFAPHGRAQILLHVGIGADNRIDAIGITADADRLRRAMLALPGWPSQALLSPFGYQGHGKRSTESSAMGREREHDAH